MNMIQRITELWKNEMKPQGFVADIPSKSESVMEYGDIEEYFPGLGWDEVDPEYIELRHMCALMYMNDQAAKYYAQSYLAYLASERATETLYNVPDDAVWYFEGEFSILPKLNKEQRELAQEIVANYESSQNT